MQSARHGLRVILRLVEELRHRRIGAVCAVIGGSLDLASVDFISGGAITSAALYCLARVSGLSGSARVIEPDRLDLTNLNRYMLARRRDVGALKSDLFTGNLTEALELFGVAARYDNGSATRLVPLGQRVLVGVDDIPSRWRVQEAWPEWLCVGATQSFEATASVHRPGQPCAGCLHPDPLDQEDVIPTISFVSFWAGLMQALLLMAELQGKTLRQPVTWVWPFASVGPQVLAMGLVANRGCPIQCLGTTELAA